MPPHPYPFSRKLVRSICSNIERVKHGTFDERDIKELLIDLRELAKYVKQRLAGESSDFTKAILQFIEICDFVAHAHRDRGVVEQNIRQHAKALNTAFPTATLEEFSALPVANVINTDTLVSALIGIAYLGLSSENKTISSDYFSPVAANKDDVALCILSILQDSIIELDENEGYAILHVMPYEGKYRLYCTIINSRIEREFRERTGGTGRFFMGFPVIVSDALCVDDIPSGDPVGLPQIVETFRDSENRLRVRVVK